MMVGKKQLKHLSTLGYLRVLADAATGTLVRGFWQYQHDNGNLYRVILNYCSRSKREN
jgi:hypothetical protein